MTTLHPESTAELEATVGPITEAATTARPRRRRRRGGLLAPVIAGACFIGLWYAIHGLLQPSMRFLLPMPHQVLLDGFCDHDTLVAILRSLWVTAYTTGIGLVISVAIGTAWGGLMSQGRWAKDALYPYAVVLQCVPIVAIVPLIGFWFGAELKAKLIVVVLCSVFPMVSYAFFGFKSVDAGHLDLFRLGGANRWEIFAKLQFPGALPALMTGIQVCGSLCVVGAIVADVFFGRGSNGIGSLMNLYQTQYQPIPLFASIIAACLFGVFVFLLFGLVGRLAVGRWHHQHTL